MIKKLSVLLAVLALSLCAAPSHAVLVIQDDTSVVERAIVVSAVSSTHAFALKYADMELWRTTDGGSAWAKVGPSLGGEYTSVEFVSPTTGFIGGGDGIDAIIKKTTDGGMTAFVDVTPAPAPQGTVIGIKFFDADNGVFYTDDKDTPLYKTSDGGTNWETINIAVLTAMAPPPDELIILSVEYFGSKDNLLVTGQFTTPGAIKEMRIYRSTDGGTSWTIPYNSGNDKSTGRFIQAVNDTVVYAVGNPTDRADPGNIDKPVGTFVLRSNDTGQTWSKVYDTADVSAAGCYFVTPEIGWIGGRRELPEKRPFIARTVDGLSTVTDITPDDVKGAGVSSFVASFSGIKQTPKFYTGFYRQAGIGACFIMSNVPPTVRSIAPATLETNATYVMTIQGANFEAGLSTIEVANNGVSFTTYEAVSGTIIRGTVNVASSAPGGTKTVRVFNPDGYTATGTFYVSPDAVSVTGAAPRTFNTGTAANSITITGDGFKEGLSLEATNAGVTITYMNRVSLNTIHAVFDVSSSAPAGAFTFKVMNQDGTWGETPLLTMVGAPPELTLAVPHYSNGAYWRPESDGPLVVETRPRVTSGTGHFIMMIPFSRAIVKVPVDFSVNQGLIAINPGMFPAGVSNGVYKMRIIDGAGKKLADQKIAVYRGR